MQLNKLNGTKFQVKVWKELLKIPSGETRTYKEIAILIGSAIIFSFGIIYLGYIIGFEKAVAAGLLPFIPSELFKIALAVALIPTLHKIITK